MTPENVIQLLNLQDNLPISVGLRNFQKSSETLVETRSHPCHQCGRRCLHYSTMGDVTGQAHCHSNGMTSFMDFMTNAHQNHLT